MPEAAIELMKVCKLLARRVPSKTQGSFVCTMVVSFETQGALNLNTDRSFNV